MSPLLAVSPPEKLLSLNVTDLKHFLPAVNNSALGVDKHPVNFQLLMISDCCRVGIVQNKLFAIY